MQITQLLLKEFAAEGEAARIRNSVSKSEAIILNQKRIECLLRVGDKVLPKV